jgi:transposase InsO family protein
MVDTGAARNYIDPDFVNRHEIPWKDKEILREVTNANGELFAYNGGIVDKEVHIQNATTQGITYPITFDVLRLEGKTVILGKPWLKDRKPTVNWDTGQVTITVRSQPQRRKIRKKKQKEKNVQPDSTKETLRHKQWESRKAERATAEEPRLRPGIRHKQSNAIGVKQRHTLNLIRQEVHRMQEWQEASKVSGRLDNVPEQYRKYTKVFAEELETGVPEHSEWDHEICLVEGKKTHFLPIYNLSATELQTLKEYVEDNVRKGYIRRSTSPAGYPVMFVPKKNGKLRLVVDYRKLNDITIKDRTPLPLITEMRDRLHGKTIFTAMDLKGAYNLIRVKEGDEWKTAFRTKSGLFEYLVMPFGLTNAPATFQRMINNVLREFIDDFVVVYLDDILIFSDNEEQHTQHVHKVLQALQDAKLLVEPEKSHFHVQEVEFLGHIIAPNTIRMDPKKVAAVREWEEPTNVKEVQSFLGFANYYRRFIKGFGDITKSLTNLTKKDQPWKWEKEEQKAFDCVKERITNEPILITFDPDKTTIVETDASDFALGAVISQNDKDGIKKPIAFWSKKLSGPALRYPIYDKEFMAIVEAFKEWRHYLQGSKHKVIVYTDHRNIEYFATTQQLSARQVRYAETLSSFDYVIIHQKGSENGRADALSRRSDYEQEIPKETRQLFQKNTEGHYEPIQLNHVRETTTVETDDNFMHDNLMDQVETKYDEEELGKKGIHWDYDNFGFTYNLVKWVGPNMVQRCIRRIHDHPTTGHRGVFATMDKIRDYYDWPGIKQDVINYIKKCQLCNKTKASRHKPYGHLKQLQVPQRPWQSISWDFIVKLPRSKKPGSKDSFDSIFVIIDRLTKYAYFIAYNEATDAKDMATHFIEHIASQHGVPEEIISDRGSTFTSKFWQELAAQLGINHKLSTAYHPQTDGQTERVNQVVEQYLRCYINYDQDDWVKWLPLAQYCYNSTKSATTKISPFFANYGYEPKMWHNPRTGPMNQQAIIEAEHLKELHDAIQQEILFVNQKIKKYYDAKRSPEPIFGEGDMVYLSRRNIKTKRPSDKLDYKKLGPFRIIRKVSSVNYELDLPETMHCHPIFHIALLEPAEDDDEPTQDCIEVEAIEPEYEVEHILEYKVTREGQELYLVKWKGYDDSENTWEPPEHLENAKQKITQFRKAAEPPTRKPRDQRPQNPTNPKRTNRRR